MRFARSIAICSLLVLAPGCAIEAHGNRRTLNALDSHWTPSSNTGRWIAAPLTLPVGVIGLAADAVVVHPCCVFDDAWGDTREWLWKPEQESRFRRAVITPLRLLATPFVFVGDWLGRAVFDVDARQEEK